MIKQSVYKEINALKESTLLLRLLFVTGGVVNIFISIILCVGGMFDGFDFYLYLLTALFGFFGFCDIYFSVCIRQYLNKKDSIFPQIAVFVQTSCLFLFFGSITIRGVLSYKSLAEILVSALLVSSIVVLGYFGYREIRTLINLKKSKSE